MQLQEFLDAYEQGGERSVTATFDFVPEGKELVLVFDPPYGAILDTRENRESEDPLKGYKSLAVVVGPAFASPQEGINVGDVDRYQQNVGTISQIEFVADDAVRSESAE